MPVPEPVTSTRLPFTFALMLNQEIVASQRGDRRLLSEEETRGECQSHGFSTALGFLSRWRRKACALRKNVEEFQPKLSEPTNRP
jgi:hypothetical protein